MVDLRSCGTRAGFLSRVLLNASGGVLRGWKGGDGDLRVGGRRLGLRFGCMR